MANTPFLKHRSFQFRGPNDSGDYNLRIEESYRDLVALYNRARIIETDQAELYRCATKDIIFLSRMVDELTTRIKALEGSANTISFSTDENIDNLRFISTEFEIPTSSRCSSDTVHGIITLPKVETSSLSKLFFTNTDDVDVLPGTLETRVVANQSSADSASSAIDSSEPELAIIKRSGRIWERNVIVSSPDSGGAELTFYVKIPTDLFTTEKSNAIVLHPYPVFGTDVLDVSYTSATSVIMDDSDNYIPLNYNGLYSGDMDSIGWVPPGGWSGDINNNAGPKIYYFDPTLVTGIRLKLRQRSYFQESSRYIYSYGLSKLDLRYDKFLDIGKTIVRFDAPEGQTISSIDDVQPSMWNIPEAVLGDVFNFRVIWETAFNSGIYTTTPVSLSKRVWIEVILAQDSGGATPALSNLVVSYS